MVSMLMLQHSFSNMALLILTEVLKMRAGVEEKSCWLQALLVIGDIDDYNHDHVSEENIMYVVTSCTKARDENENQMLET